MRVNVEWNAARCTHTPFLSAVDVDAPFSRRTFFESDPPALSESPSIHTHSVSVISLSTVGLLSDDVGAASFPSIAKMSVALTLVNAVIPWYGDIAATPNILVPTLIVRRSFSSTSSADVGTGGKIAFSLPLLLVDVKLMALSGVVGLVGLIALAESLGGESGAVVVITRTVYGIAEKSGKTGMSGKESYTQHANRLREHADDWSGNAAHLNLDLCIVAPEPLPYPFLFPLRPPPVHDAPSAAFFHAQADRILRHYRKRDDVLPVRVQHALAHADSCQPVPDCRSLGCCCMVERWG